MITATQMLESMIHAPEPTRAEVADVANAVIDGSSAVMLSAETSVGSYPVEAVRTMATIAEAAEEVPEIHGRARTPRGDTVAAAVMHSAVELAEEIDAAALVVPTATGGAARACSKYRRRRPIIALAHDPLVAAQLTLEWGVYPASMHVAESVDDMIDEALEAAAQSFPELGMRRHRRPHRRAADGHAGSDQPDHGPRAARDQPARRRLNPSPQTSSSEPPTGTASQRAATSCRRSETRGNASGVKLLGRHRPVIRAISR